MTRKEDVARWIISRSGILERGGEENSYETYLRVQTEGTKAKIK
jgi:hypothetical protein